MQRVRGVKYQSFEVEVESNVAEEQNNPAVFSRHTSRV